LSGFVSVMAFRISNTNSQDGDSFMVSSMKL